MFISHETKCVNMDNIDSMEVAHRDLYNDYVIEIRKNNSIVLCIYSSGHMTFEEAKFVYECLIASINGLCFDTRYKKWIKVTEEFKNVMIVDEENVDWTVKLYHEHFEKKEDTPDNSQ